MVALGATIVLRIEVQGELDDLLLPGIERAVCHIHDADEYL